MRPGCLIGLLLLAAAGYAGVKILASEMSYRSLQETASQEARLAETKTDEEIRQTVLAKAQELELPPGERDIQVRRLGDGNVLVRLAYPDTTSFLGRWEWVRIREISVRGPR